MDLLLHKFVNSILVNITHKFSLPVLSLLYPLLASQESILQHGVTGLRFGVVISLQNVCDMYVSQAENAEPSCNAIFHKFRV